MFGKKISQLDFSDIKYLVEVQKTQEGYNLDYKRAIGNPDKAKNELAKDISSFANSSGGFLVIGIDDNLAIKGVDKVVKNKSIDEWINQVVSSNTEPSVFYLDPKIIEVPETDKVIVVIEIPESTKKPHIVKDLYSYFIRINDSSKKANHSQIRDMFEFSKNRSNEFNSFLKSRNILDHKDPRFGETAISKNLYSEVPSYINQEKPKVLFSVTPKFPMEEKLNVPFSEFKNWLEQNSDGYKPVPHMNLYFGRYDYDLMLDGVILKHTNNHNLISYFEILNNGFVEAGFSSSVTYCYKQDGNNAVSIYLTQIVAYEMILLEWVKRFYQYINYNDKVLIQLSFVNVQNLKLFGFHQKYNDLNRYGRSEIKNKHNKNFKLNYSFNPIDLNQKEIIEIVKDHSEKICRAFGLEKDYAFVDNKISVGNLGQIV